MKVLDLKKLNGKFPEIKVDKATPNVLNLGPDSLTKVAKTLKEDYGFDHLANLTAVDYKDYLEVVYNLYSYGTGANLTLKVRLPTEKPDVDSVAGIWPTANWQEREVYDFFGIVFNNHPDFRRLFLVEDFPGYPLRKRFKLEYNEEFLLGNQSE